MSFYKVFTFFLVVQLLFACSEFSIETEEVQVEKTHSKPNSIRFSKGFSIVETNGITKLTVYNPFADNELENTFILLKKGQNYSPSQTETVIEVPIETIAPFSTTFYRIIEELEETNSIVAIANSSIVFSSTIQSGVANGEITQVGDDAQLNVEKMILLYPDVVVVNGYSGGISPSFVKLQEAGIPIIKNYDWKETTPLARAEWIKFFGALYGESDKADSIFNQIEINYNNYKAAIDSVEELPNLLFSSAYQGTWYIPGGKSYVAQLVKDAKGTYPWSSDSTTGSIPLSMEVVAQQMLDADIWFSSQSHSLDNLKQKDSRYAEFKPFKEGNVYEHDKRRTKMGGDDFWETGGLRVDLVLKDYINIIHPGILEDQSLTFFRKLE